MTDPPSSMPNAVMPVSSDLGQRLLDNVPVQTISTTPPQLPGLSVEATLEFWVEDLVIRRTMEEGGEEVMRSGLCLAAEQADQPLEEHLRRSGVGILRDYDGQPNFFQL